MVSVWTLLAEMAGLFAGYMLFLFLPAGTLDWVEGWVFLAIFFICGTAIVLWLFKVNPGLLNERMTGLSKSNQKPWDRPLLISIIILYVIWIAVMPLDTVRFRWSHIPTWAQVVGGIIFVVSFYMLFLVYRENSFLSPVERIQRERGQTVISTGPYRYVRHPMYSSSLVQFVGASLMLGSWAGLIVGFLMMVVLSRRAVLEEIMLCNELPGYEGYMERVRYRMIPYIW